MTTPKKKPKDVPASFSDISDKIDELTRELESSDIPLEKASSVYAEAVELIKQAQERLNTAEKQIAIIEDSSSPSQSTSPEVSD